MLSIGVGIATLLGTDLLILDEPTDGFSKEQLSKFRDVLTELKCPQVILVSHERELEAFADHVQSQEGERNFKGQPSELRMSGFLGPSEEDDREGLRGSVTIACSKVVGALPSLCELSYLLTIAPLFAKIPKGKHRLLQSTTTDELSRNPFYLITETK